MEVESQLKANKVEIENRQHAVQDLQKRIGEYQGRLNMTPMREQQMAGLTRDYEQSKKNLRATAGEARPVGYGDRAGEAAARGAVPRDSILQTFPQKPFSPNRLKLNLIGLVAGLMMGAGLAGTEIFDDRIYSKEELAAIVSAPVLAEIPPLPTAAEEGHQVRAEWMQRGVLSA